MPTVEDMAVAKKLAADIKAEAIGVAKLRGLGIDQRQYTPEEELLMFNALADGWTVAQEEQLLTEGKTRNEVGALKYPHRMPLAASGERALSKYEQAKYLADMARKVDPTWTPTPPPGSTPPPPTYPTMTEAPPPQAGPPDVMGG